ncbi:MAG: hypothetical protein FWE23_08845 [Chitinivibrionia bacterium]|nr:hypothetical protein [Chitinivibrionia bacterium]
MNISTLADLQNFRNQVNIGVSFAGQTITLLNDIWMPNTTPWIPIANRSGDGGFNGTFDGGGFTISGVFVPQNVGGATNRFGLFGLIAPEGNVQRLTVSGTINGASHIGFIAGENRGVIDHCSASGNIGGGSRVGSICGLNSGEIIRCRATGVIGSVNDQYLGGIAGASSGIIEESYVVNSTMTGFQFVGGLVGEHSGGYIENCYTRANITSQAGGGFIGGFAGSSLAPINNCYATGTVPAAGVNFVGLFAGQTSGFGHVSASYAITRATLPFIAQNVVSPNPADGRRSEGQMRTQSTFSGWNFNWIWQMPPNNSINDGFPILDIDFDPPQPNDYPLVITKHVIGGVAPNQDFTIRVSINGTPQPAFTLRNGQSRVFDLAVGDTFTVSEDKIAGFDPQITPSSGTMQAGGAQVDVNNVMYPLPQTLTISKLVSGGVDTTTQFEIHVYIGSGAAPSEVIFLRHGESYSMQVLENTSYFVDEVPNPNFRTTIHNQSGVMPAVGNYVLVDNFLIPPAPTKPPFPDSTDFEVVPRTFSVPYWSNLSNILEVE